MEELILFINNMGDNARTTFAPITESLKTISYFFPAFGMIIFVLNNFLIQQFKMKMIDFNIDKLVVFMILFAFYSQGQTLVKSLDDLVFKIPAKSALKDLSSSASSFSQKYENYNKQLIAKKEQVRSNFEAKNESSFLGLEKLGLEMKIMFKDIKIFFYQLFLLLICAVFIIAILIQMVFSIYGAELMIALFPIAFGLQFIPFYSGSLANYFKNLLALRIITAVVAALASSMFKLNLIDTLYQSMINSLDAMYSNGDKGMEIDIFPLITLGIMILMVGVIPSIVDKALNATASGALSGTMTGAAFAGAATGMAMSTVKDIAKGGAKGADKLEKNVTNAGEKTALGLKNIENSLDKKKGGGNNIE